MFNLPIRGKKACTIVVVYNCLNILCPHGEIGTPRHCKSPLLHILSLLPPPPKKNMMTNSFFFSPLLSCRYVVRAKSGRKQSSKDASGKGVHSAGASLRRHNEFALKKVFNAKVVAIAVF